MVDAETGSRVVDDEFHILDKNGFSCGLLAATPIADKYTYGFINPSGEWVISPQFSHAESFSCGLSKVIVGGKVGYIEPTGGYVIQPQYDWGSSFQDGFAVVGTLTLLGQIQSRVRDAEADMAYQVIDCRGQVVDESLARSFIAQAVPHK